MITFTHDELLMLRWLVDVHGTGSLEADRRSFILMKLDKMLAEDGQRLVLHSAMCLRH